VFGKHYILVIPLALICLLLFAAVPLGGTNLLEILVCLSAFGVTGGLLWYLFMERKSIFVQVESLKNDYKGQRDKASQCSKETKDLRLSVQLLKRQKRNTEAIIYSIPDVVIVTDASDRLLMANEPAGEFLGFDVKDTMLKPLDELAEKKELVKLIRNSRTTRVRHVKHELQFGSGDNIRIYNCIVSCIFDDDDHVCGVVTILHDISREKEISQMKNEFVGHVSHELKTPLASITAYAEMLVDGEAADEKTRKEFYSIIQSQAQRLNRLIEDILNISRIESGLIKVHKEPVSTALIVRDAVQMIKSYAAEKDIKVEDQTAVVFDQVSADKDMISQVVINLLSNAVKYTPNGGKVAVNSEVDESQQVVRVTITDTGVGISADELTRVFDKFYRVKANNKCAKGTGLGLNLVKQIVEKVHQGRVFVTSEVGKGSSFGFELPLITAEKTIIK
jgi:two-component system phosphate regulon sensor histidine kinase PhoR